MIFRRGKWDLPKGKLDKGETPGQAAIREVGEECGVTGLHIVKPLEPTYHIYPIDGGNALKKSYWYEMTCPGDDVLKPQTEEDITEVRWMTDAEVTESMRNTYCTIK